MMHGDFLRALLRPLGVYDVDARYNGSELDAVGAALDDVMAGMEEIEREMSLATAEDWGVERMAALFAGQPAARGGAQLSTALAALLRIGGDSFTTEAINDTLAGCGVGAVASETEVPGEVEIRFPGVPGIPAGFEEICTIVEMILPAHVQIAYIFWYLVWDKLEAELTSWASIEALGLDWTGLETRV